MTYTDFGSKRSGEGHWHVVPSAGNSIETDHQAWHETGEACILCGRIAWTVGTHHLTPSGLPLRPCYGGGS